MHACYADASSRARERHVCSECQNFSRENDNSSLQTRLPEFRGSCHVPGQFRRRVEEASSSNSSRTPLVALRRIHRPTSRCRIERKTRLSALFGAKGRVSCRSRAGGIAAHDSAIKRGVGLATSTSYQLLGLQVLVLSVAVSFRGGYCIVLKFFIELKSLTCSAIFSRDIAPLVVLVITLRQLILAFLKPPPVRGVDPVSLASI